MVGNAGEVPTQKKIFTFFDCPSECQKLKFYGRVSGFGCVEAAAVAFDEEAAAVGGFLKKSGPEAELGRGIRDEDSRERIVEEADDGRRSQGLFCFVEGRFHDVIPNEDRIFEDEFSKINCEGG